VKLDALQSNWDEFGKVDPFWAILSDPRRKNSKWNTDEFFQTGRAELETVLKQVAERGIAVVRRGALDFGCGVGRLTQALGPHFESVVGVDIAPSMIALARKNNRFGDRCRYIVNGNDDLRIFDDGAFSFIYSRIVLQHIPSEHSRKYIAEFLRVLGKGGVLVFQVPSQKRAVDFAVEALPEGAYRAEVKLRVPRVLTSAATVTVGVRVTNKGSSPWPSLSHSGEGCNITVGNHWRFADGRMLVNDDGRLPLPRTIAPSESFEGTFPVRTPREPGDYRLEVDLVQEGVTWFEAKGSPVCRAEVTVRRPGFLKRKIARVLARAAAKTERVIEYPQLEIHPVPKEAILEMIDAAGARLVDAADDQSAGQGWESYLYFVVKN
jgi:SAM-dependent methyltransferase